MIILSLIILILITALPSFFSFLPENCYNRITSIVLLFSAILTFNSLDFESIGSGIALYDGLYHITIITQFMDIILAIQAKILLVCSLIKNSQSFSFYLNSPFSKYLISFVISVILMFYINNYKANNKL